VDAVKVEERTGRTGPVLVWLAVAALTALGSLAVLNAFDVVEVPIASDVLDTLATVTAMFTAVGGVGVAFTRPRSRKPVVSGVATGIVVAVFVALALADGRAKPGPTPIPAASTLVSPSLTPSAAASLPGQTLAPGQTSAPASPRPSASSRSTGVTPSVLPTPSGNPVRIRFQPNQMFAIRKNGVTLVASDSPIKDYFVQYNEVAPMVPAVVGRANIAGTCDGAEMTGAGVGFNSQDPPPMCGKSNDNTRVKIEIELDPTDDRMRFLVVTYL
jgi:hypothetical protein